MNKARSISRLYLHSRQIIGAYEVRYEEIQGVGKSLEVEEYIRWIGEHKAIASLDFGRPFTRLMVDYVVLSSIPAIYDHLTLALLYFLGEPGGIDSSCRFIEMLYFLVKHGEPPPIFRDRVLAPHIAVVLHFSWLEVGAMVMAGGLYQDVQNELTLILRKVSQIQRYWPNDSVAVV